jgi:glutamyl-tRNA reductase
MQNKLFAIGVNHHLCSSELRSKISISKDAQPIFYKSLLKTQIYGVVLSTCNRTEIYGYGDSDLAKKVLLDFISLNHDVEIDFINKQGVHAIKHVLSVASGIDSQIVGDLEILGQFKNAFYLAKKNNALNGCLERLLNTAIQSAKEVRCKTNLSNGSVTMSYYVVKYIKQLTNNAKQNILLIGTGEFGNRIAHNIADYLPNAVLSICNRTRQKAEEIANELNCKVYSFDDRVIAVQDNDVIISSVNDSGNYIIHQSELSKLSGSKMFIDMSVPLSIEPSIGQNNILVTIDEVGHEINSTLESRKEDIPVALEIIEKHLTEFVNWTEIFEKSESIQSWKTTLLELSSTCPFLVKMEDGDKNRVIGKSMAQFANYIKQRSDLPKDTQEIIHQFLIECENALTCQRASVQKMSHEIDNCSACQAR